MSAIGWSKLQRGFGRAPLRRSEARGARGPNGLSGASTEDAAFESLIAVLEKAEAGGIQLNREAGLAAGWTVVGKDLNGREIWLSPDSRNTSWLPAFTQSLDAALKLVPEGERRPMEVRLSVNDRIKGGLSTCEIRDDVGAHHITVRRALAVAKTAALAACVAALETRRALELERARPGGLRPAVND